MPTLELYVLVVGLWTLVLNIPVGDKCTFICTKKIGSSCIGARRERCLVRIWARVLTFRLWFFIVYEFFRVIQARFYSSSNSSHFFNTPILSFDSNKLWLTEWLTDRLAGWLTDWLTDWIISWGIFILDKPVAHNLVTKFVSLVETHSSNTVFKRHRHLSVSWARWIQSTPSEFTSVRFVLIFYHWYVDLPGGLLP